MFTAAQLAIQLGDEEQTVAVLVAIGTGAHLAEGRGVFATYVALVPRTFPTTYDEHTDENIKIDLTCFFLFGNRICENKLQYL